MERNTELNIYDMLYETKVRYKYDFIMEIFINGYMDPEEWLGI